MTNENLRAIPKALDESFVMKDLRKYKDMPALLHTNSRNFFLTYPALVAKAMQNFCASTARPKSEKEARPSRLPQGARLDRPVRRRVQAGARLALELDEAP